MPPARPTAAGRMRCGLRKRLARGGAAIAVLGLVACSHEVYHRVRPGDTLYRISQAYGVPVERLTAVNHLVDASRIEIGQRLRIPGARHELPVDVITPRSTAARSGRGAEHSKAPVVLAWPVVGGTVTSRFGQRGQSFHDGIDIGAPIGSPVHAAQDGEVIYSDALRGYGNMIIVRHSHGVATVYAHNQHNSVREGQRVRCGDVIATVGESGRTSGANLHFEVRHDNVAQDPLEYLPALEQVSAPKPAGGPGG